MVCLPMDSTERDDKEKPRLALLLDERRLEPCVHGGRHRVHVVVLRLNLCPRRVRDEETPVAHGVRAEPHAIDTWATRYLDPINGARGDLRVREASSGDE